VAAAQQGVAVASVVPGSPAESAGLTPGDVITSIDGTKVTSSAAMSRAIRAKKPGSTISVSYVDGTGTSRTLRVRLASGPAQ
jgi:S1-C subfamily serine protease